MKRTHLSKLDKIVLDNKPYVQDSFKPVGFWYQIDDSWEQWCREQMPEWLNERYANKHHIKLDTSDMLILKNENDMYRFNIDYKLVTKFNSYPDKIDWERVSKTFTGIEISIYFYQFRNDPKFFWYYPWDVASGCVFDTSIIKSINKI